MPIPNLWRWLPIFWKIFKGSFKKIHFRGYTVNIKERKIIQIDSLRWTNRKIQPLIKLQKCCLKIHRQPLKPFFLERKQFYANCYGVWLAAEMCSYLINLPEISDKHNAFIAYNLLERKLIPLVLYWRSDERNCLCGFLNSFVDKWFQKVQVFQAVST